MVVFLLNGFVFIIIGLQLPGILRELRGESLTELIDDALLVSGAAVLIRIGWVFVATYLPRSMSKRLRERDSAPGWRNVALMAWAGKRGKQRRFFGGCSEPVTRRVRRSPRATRTLCPKRRRLQRWNCYASISASSTGSAQRGATNHHSPAQSACH